MEQLQKIGHQGKTRNFTQEFIETNPDFLELGCKDYNEYLIAKTKQRPP